MKRSHRLMLLTVPALFMAMSVQAHDSKEHMKGAQKPECAALEDMDHSKMDMQDPVMQAMTQQCMQETHTDEASHDKDETSHGHAEREMGAESGHGH